ncbi:sodium:solute symporter [Oceanobacillus oncorhynchi subsp. oncorhynchi]|uniref:sodium:solute symporter family protein n=1 Tax=Oceanobacillus oncorhynchi TaxID=545501 RepID=UPI0036294F33
MPVNTFDIIIVLFYLALVLYIGYYSMKRISGFKDYTVAGRSMPMALIFATLAATLAGGGATIGRVAFVYETGLVIFLAVFGVVFSQILIGQFVAPRVRNLGNVYTVGDVFGYFYGRSGKLVSGIFSFLYSVGMFGVQVLAMGRILETMTGFDYIPMTILGSVITVIYTWGGGMLAVIYTDAIQFIILTIGIATTLTLALNNIGGVPAIVEKVSAIDAGILDFTGGWTIAAMIAFFLTFLLGEALAPFYIQRYASSRNALDSKRSVTYLGIFYFFMTTAVVFIGLAGVVLLPGTDPDLVFTTLILEHMPTGAIGLIFGGLIAAVMSTGDSILNTASTIFTRDIYQEFINPKATDKQMLNLAKWSTLIVGIGGILVALLIPNVFDLMVFIFDLWAPSIVPVIIIALLWGKARDRKVSPYAAIPAILAGIISSLLWNYGLNEPFEIPTLIVGICMNLLTFFIAHQLTKKKQPTRAFMQEDLNPQG